MKLRVARVFATLCGEAQSVEEAMSDSWVIFVPKDPEHVPPQRRAKVARDLLEGLTPDVVEIDVIQNPHIQFFDCGGNLEAITCPLCDAKIDFQWWGQAMASDFDTQTGVRLDAQTVPCCSRPVPLHELAYQFHQAFGRFALRAKSPNIEKVPDDAVRAIEAALGCDVAVVYRHI